jgi:hypothetical protein
MRCDEPRASSAASSERRDWRRPGSWAAHVKGACRAWGAGTPSGKLWNAPNRRAAATASARHRRVAQGAPFPRCAARSSQDTTRRRHGKAGGQGGGRHGSVRQASIQALLRCDLPAGPLALRAASSPYLSTPLHTPNPTVNTSVTCHPTSRPSPSRCSTPSTPPRRAPATQSDTRKRRQAAAPAPAPAVRTHSVPCSKPT